MAQTYLHVTHGFGPVYDASSRILILGSFPSVRSRERQFYYAHPRNRFWPLMERLLREDVPEDTEGRKALLLRHGIALWDSIESCDIRGSADSAIKNAVPTDIRLILSAARIRAVFTNGAASSAVYRRYQRSAAGMDCIPLPSTSPANAAASLETLYEAWKTILGYLG